MSDWQRTLDLTPQFQKAQEGGMTVAELARVVCDRMETQNPVTRFGQHLEDERIDIAERFRDIADGCGEEEDFDEAMRLLYDWADTPLDDRFGGKKLCWVNTF